MAKCKGPTLELLLIIAMMIQPVVFAHAMATTDHTDHHASFSAMHSHEGHEATHGDVAVAQHDHGAATGALIDCCYSALCCAAIALDAEVIVHSPNAAFSKSPSSRWHGVDLPTEIRPPRNLLG